MELNHFDKNGNAVMVDVSDKPVTHRTATATGSIQVSPEIMAAVKSGNVKKGDTWCGPCGRYHGCEAYF